MDLDEEKQDCCICDQKIYQRNGYSVNQCVLPHSGSLLGNVIRRIARIKINEKLLLCVQCYDLFERLDLSEHTISVLRTQITDQLTNKYGNDVSYQNFIDIACQTEELLYTVKDDVVTESIKVEEPEGLDDVEQSESAEAKKTHSFSCKVCSVSFRKSAELKKHMKKHKSEVKTFECEFCQNIYLSKAGLQWHINHKHNDDNTENNESNEQNENEIENENEKEQEQPSEDIDPSFVLECNIKVEKLEEEDLLVGNVEEVQNDNSEYNSETSKSKATDSKPKRKRGRPSKRHIKLETDESESAEKKSRDSENSNNYDETTEDEDYEPRSHPVKPKRGRPRKDDLDFNVKPYIYPCSQCPKMWRTKSELKIHMVSHSDVRAHVCDICGQAYKKRAALDIHLGMHQGINPFTCETCGKVFTQKGALTRHLPIHTGEANYQCDLCGKRFIHHTSFSMHVLSHSGLKAYKCDICGLGLMSTSHLKRHLRAHSGEKKYGCSQCGKRFAERYNLAAHERLHFSPGGSSRKKIHTCPLCGDSFQRRQKLEEHLASSHNKILDTEENRKWAGTVLNSLQSWNPAAAVGNISVVNEGTCSQSSDSPPVNLSNNSEMADAVEIGLAQQTNVT